MSVESSKIPLPAIVFISILLGCIIILCILYQLLKRDKCCQVHGREDVEGSGDEQNLLGEDGEDGKQNTGEPVIDNATEKIGAVSSLGAVVASSSAIAGGIVEMNVGPNSVTADAAGPAAASSTVEIPEGNTTIDLSLSDASFPSINLLPVEDEPVSNCGRILLETTFSPVANKMIITVVRAADVPGVDRGGTAMVEVHLAILPNKKWRFKTTARPSNSPVFNERYTLYPVNLKMLEEMSIRVRLYGRKKLGKKVLGEIEVLMADIDLHSDLSDEPMWKTLLPYGMVAKLAALRETGEDEEFEMMMNEDDT